MAYRTRLKYTTQQLSLIWDWWNKGESLKDIGRHFNRPSSSIYSIISRTGGIRPASRVRSKLALSLSDREEISRGIAQGLSLRKIAFQLSKSPSTISREVRRNGGLESYRAVDADKAAWKRALRPKACKLGSNPKLCKVIGDKLKQKWSPEQISGWLKIEYANNEQNQVSYETIYKSLFIQTRGVLKKELTQYLRSKRTIRRSKQATMKRGTLGKINDAVSIHERPANVEDRAVPGHWEGDLIQGSNNSFVATLVERHTRYVMLAKVSGKDTESVVTALVEQAKTLPRELYKSLTWDRGSEMAGHRRFTLQTDIQIYLCDPSSPWQRGSNENTNRLLRDYLPKRTDLSAHSQKALNKIARQLNERPRKTLGFMTPAQRFNKCVAAIH